jgi:anti-sigma factor RsiW
MNCGGSRRLFGAYWDDEITAAERDWLEGHFASCPTCRGEYEEFARTIELMGSLPRVAPQPDLAERALARARRAVAVPDRLPVRTPRWIPITATAALLTIAVTMTLQWVGVVPNGRVSDPVAGNVRIEPGRVETPPPAVPQRAGYVAQTVAEPATPTGAIADSLFDHNADVEFILDPVVVRKGRAHTVLRVNPSVQGEKAVITF